MAKAAFLVCWRECLPWCFGCLIDVHSLSVLVEWWYLGDVKWHTDWFLVLISQKSKDVTFYEAECFKIDSSKKTVHCRSAVGTNLDGNGDFMLDYDYLVVALGATVNTFNTPGVLEHCHFLKVKSPKLKTLTYSVTINISILSCNYCIWHFYNIVKRLLI